MLLCLVAGSGALGYALAMQQPWSVSDVHAESDLPQLAAAETGEAMAAARSQSLLAAELGRLQAEIVNLRVLFLRLADVAQLEDGEFDLDMDFKPLQQESSDEFEPAEASEFFIDEDSRQNESETSGFRRDSLRPLAGHRQSSSAISSLEASLPLVKRNLVHISEQAARLESVYRERRLAHDFRVSGLPVVEAHVSSRYGYRVNPFTGRRQLHQGLDLGGKPGSRIMALADGIVTYSGKNGGYGNLVELEHPGGYRTRYAHNHANLVPLGARVSKGQTIATMGSTGRSTGTHLHVEVRRNGRSLDPQLYIR